MQQFLGFFLLFLNFLNKNTWARRKAEIYVRNSHIHTHVHVLLNESFSHPIILWILDKFAAINFTLMLITLPSLYHSLPQTNNSSSSSRTQENVDLKDIQFASLSLWHFTERIFYLHSQQQQQQKQQRQSEQHSRKIFYFILLKFYVNFPFHPFW